jgi:hypothetical protein
LSELYDPSVAQGPQRCSRRPRINAEMLSNQAGRTRRDQTAVAPHCIEGEVLKNDPRLRTEPAQQIPAVRPHNHATLAAGGIDGHGAALLRHPGTVCNGVGEADQPNRPNRI